MTARHVEQENKPHGQLTEIEECAAQTLCHDVGVANAMLRLAEKVGLGRRSVGECTPGKNPERADGTARGPT